MKKILMLLVLILGVTGCSYTTSNEEVNDTSNEVVSEVNEMEEIEKLTNEVITYMTNIEKQYKEKNNDKGYLDNVYRGPAISEKMDKIKNLEVSSELGTELKNKLNSTWISFVNILMEESSDDTNKESVNRSIETIKEHIEYIQSNL